jgi:hypothetical protein
MTDTRDRAAPRRAAAAAALLLVAAGCAEAPPWLRDAPDPFAFPPARHQIPGALVVSERVRLTGMLNRTPTTAHAEGAAEGLVINGEPSGTEARVRARARLALAVRAPRGYGETAVGRVRVNGNTAEFRVTTLHRPPPDDLGALGTTRAAPGRLAQSVVVAPTGFTPGAVLRVEGPTAVEVETRAGRSAPPVALDPGEPFRLITRVPASWRGPLEVRVRLGELRSAWHIRPPEPELAATPG